MNNLKVIEDTIGYAFKDKTLLERAFVHSSYANENGVESYERLEFLGDGVLGLIVAEKLFSTDSDEGDMTEKRANIVSSQPLERATEKLGLGQYILFGAGESRQQHTSKKVYADVFESVIGAIYIDGGYDKAKDFVFRTLKERIEDTLNCSNVENSKGDLQEFCQARKLNNPEYVLIKQSGTAHEPYYVVGVKINGKTYGEGKGCRKKYAEREAAKNALEILRRNTK